MTPEVEKHFTANMNISKKDIMIGNFLGGLSWGVGSAIGASVVVGIVGYILKFSGFFNGIPSVFNQFTP